jgi:hypothetical protein
VLDELKGLTSLTLNLSDGRIGNLDALKKLQGLKDLTDLRLDLHGDTRFDNLDVLKELKGLTSLTLNLSDGRIGNLDALKGLKGLTSLTLDLRGSSTGNLDALKELKGLTSLTIDLRDDRGIGSLDALKELKHLTSLRLYTDLSDLSAIRSLGTLESLTITNAQHYELGALPGSVINLTLSDES